MTPPKWTRKTPYSEAIERNLLACYYQALTDEQLSGRYWYRMANRTCRLIARQYGVRLSQAAGVLAALSPGREWSLNVQEAEGLISAWQSGARGKDLPLVGSYGRRNVEKAARILQGESPLSILGGPKVRAFYQCVLNPRDLESVCIDRHAKCAAYNVVASEDSRWFVVRTEAEYEYLAEHYRKVAGIVGLKPMELQAIVWVTWKRLKEGREWDVQ